MSKLAKYKRNCFVCWKNLYSWQKLYKTAGRGGHDKFQVCVDIVIFWIAMILLMWSLRIVRSKDFMDLDIVYFVDDDWCCGYCWFLWCCEYGRCCLPSLCSIVEVVQRSSDAPIPSFSLYNYIVQYNYI